MTFNLLALRCGVALGALAAAASASAQSPLPPEDIAETPATASDNADRGGEIVVTGSRIRRDPLAQESPITFVDKGDMEKTGLNSVNEVLQRLPSVGGGLNGKFNTSGNDGNPPDGGGVGAGSAEVDLRYLGSKRTLVLVDGLRMINGSAASGVPGAVDLNVIPEAMIERVEVLQDGASAIYGSDAIAGVINVITKKGQDGLQASAQLGSYLEEGDGFSQNYQVSWGNGRGKSTQVVVGASFNKQEPVFAGDRDISAFPSPYATSCLAGGCSSGTPLGRYIVLNQDLTLRAPVIGRRPTPADYRPWAGNADRFNFAPFNYLMTPLKRIGGFVNVDQEIGADTHLAVKLIGQRRTSKNQAAPLPLYIGPDAGNGNFLDTITIDASNPYNPFGVTLNSSNYNVIFRRLVEAGPRRFAQEVNTLYGTATLDGKFALGGSDWYWDVNGIWGRNKAEQDFQGNVNSQRLQQALGPVAACTGACVPFNYFGGVGSITPEMLSFVGYTEHNSSSQNLWGLSANASGKLFALPGGDMGLAFGAEYRELKGRFDPDPITAAGFSSDIPSQPTRGSYNVREAYAELNAPVLDMLDLTGAVRYSDYSSAGSKTTYKVGANATPFEGLRLRGSYGTGIRAPSIGELFGGQTRFDQTLTDPCNTTANPTGTVLANCRAQGVPVGYNQNNPQISVVTGGNQALKSETSKGWVIGGVFAPAPLQNRVSLEVNYYRIKINGAIQAVDAQTTLQNCVFNNDPLACAAVPRTASGQITQINGLLQNIAGIRTSGWDVNLAARTRKSDWGQLSVASNNSILKTFKQLVPTATGTQVNDVRETEQGSPAFGWPVLKSVNTLDWTGNGLGATLTGRYISGQNESNGNRIGDRFYTDAQARWEPGFMKGMGLAVGVNNLFDKDGPTCTTCGIPNYDRNLYDIPGRYYYARLSYKM